MPGTRRSSLVGAVVLVALGLFFLYSNFRPGLDPWPLLSRYWPVLLIFLGLKMNFQLLMDQKKKQMRKA